MAIITDYNTLVQAVKDTAEDDGLEFSNFIPISIQLAQNNLLKELDFPDLEETVSGSLSYQNDKLNKPSDFRLPIYFSVVSNNKRKLLKFRQTDFLVDYWPNASLTDTPKYYSNYSGELFQIAPTPDISYSYELRYLKDIPLLTNLVTTNYFVEECPNILFFAVMVEQSKFMKAWSQVQFWQNELTQARDLWNLEMSRKRRDNGEFPSKPGGPNTVKHTITSNA